MAAGTRDRADRYTGSENGRRYAKTVAKTKTRRRERDGDHDITRLYNAGRRDAGEDE